MCAMPNPTPAATPGLLAAEPRVARTLALLVVGLVTAWRLATLAAGWVPLYADEMQYWTWSRDLAVGYDTKPPMIAWIIRLSTALAGDGSFGIRLSTPLIHAATALTLFWVGRALVSPRVGALSAICYIALPGISVSALVASVDPALLMFWAFALAAVIKAEGGGARPAAHPALWWALAGAFTGCALLTKYAAIAFPASLLLYLLIARRLRVFTTAGPYAYAAALLAVFSPNLMWNLATGFVAVGHVIQDGEYDTASLFNPREMLDFLGGQFAVFGPVTFGALLYAFARWRRSCGVPGVRLLLCFAVVLLGFMTVQALLSQANANWAAAAYVSATVAVVALMDVPRWRALLVWTLAAHLGLAVAVPLVEPVGQATGLFDNARRDPFRRMRGWDELAAAIDAVRQAHGDLPVVLDERRYIAAVMYHSARHLDGVHSWNADGRVDSQYDLSADAIALVGQDLLIVTRGNGSAYQGHFRELEALPDIAVPTHEDGGLLVHVWLGRGFLGYDDAGGS
ncbi:MAG: glycosyltransferase family 39 protein [Rhodospirillaceae bacterium]|nr:glycosyltransferase family 39 protein [Rhodospirillaceae bacterium]